MHETTEKEKKRGGVHGAMTLSGKHGWVAWLQLVVDLRELRVAPRLTSEKLCWLASPRLTCRGGGFFVIISCAGATHFQEAPVFPLPVPSSSRWLSLAGFAPPPTPAPPPCAQKATAKHSVYDTWVFTCKDHKIRTRAKNWQARAVRISPGRFRVNRAWVSRETKTVEAVFVPESFLFCFVLFFLRFAAAVCKRRRLQPVTTKQPPLLSFVAVNVLQCFQLFNQGLVLVFQHSHAVFQTFDVLFLFPAALASCLPGEGKRKKRKKGERCLSRLMKTFLHPGPQTKCELCTIQREQMFSRLSGLKVLLVNCFHV